MHDAAVEPAESFLVNGAPHHDRADRHVAAAQRFRNRDDVRLEIVIFKTPPAAGAAEPGLHLVANQQRAMLPAKMLRLAKKVVPRKLHPFSLHRFDHDCRETARCKLRLERRKIAGL